MGSQKKALGTKPSISPSKKMRSGSPSKKTGSVPRKKTYRRNSASKYRGVSKNSGNKKPWYARISHRRKTYYLGSFATEEEAMWAYETAAREMGIDEVDQQYNDGGDQTIDVEKDLLCHQPEGPTKDEKEEAAAILLLLQQRREPLIPQPPSSPLQPVPKPYKPLYCDLVHMTEKPKLPINVSTPSYAPFPIHEGCRFDMLHHPASAPLSVVPLYPAWNCLPAY